MISQLAEDTSISLEVSQPQAIATLLDILNLFKNGSSLEINWRKSHAYWCSSGRKQSWLKDIGWQWAEEKDFSKLLSTPFGLNLETENIDNFLVDRIKAKLAYKCTTKLSLTGRAMIVK